MAVQQRGLSQKLKGQLCARGAHRLAQAHLPHPKRGARNGRIYDIDARQYQNANHTGNRGDAAPLLQPPG